MNNINSIFKYAPIMKSKCIGNDNIDGTIFIYKNEIHMIAIDSFLKIKLQNLNSSKNIAIKIEDLDKLKTRDTNYSLIGLENRNVIICKQSRSKSKNGTSNEVKDLLTGRHGYCGLDRVIENIEFNNSIRLDGYMLLTILKECKELVSFCFEHNAFGIKKDNLFIDLSNLMTVEIDKNDLEEYKNTGLQIQNILKVLSLTKKDNEIRLSFNKEVICFSKNNAEVYLLACRI